MISIPNFFLPSLFCASGQLQRGLPPPLRSFGNVEIAPFKGGAPAAVSISADFELAWAWRNLSSEAMEARGAAERENVPRLVAMLDRHRIPITWATVGHLFLESCKRGTDGCGHPEMARPAKNFGWDGDWYVHDPCSDVCSAPSWYCPDLIKLIQQSDVGHEIGTHSFSHIDFGPDGADTALVQREMEACIEVMRPFGLHPRSLVYCFNHMGHQHLPLLAALGLTSVRDRDRVRLAYPERTDAGVYKIRESMNLRFARRYDYVAKADLFLRESQKRSAAFHIWFHPSDSWSVFTQVFDPILNTIASYRDRGEVWVATMQDLASYCEARAMTDLAVTTTPNATRIAMRSTVDVNRFGTPDITLVVALPNNPARIIVIRDGVSQLLSPSAVVRGRQPGTIQFDVSCRAEQIDITT